MPFTPDSSAQIASSISYGKDEVVTTATELPLVAGYISNYAGAVKKSEVEYNLSFDPTAIAKKSTFTLTAPTPTATDTVTITITDGSATPKVKKYIYEIQAGDTEAEIANGLAALANTNPFVTVTAVTTASPAVFTVVGVIPGQDYTLAIAKTGTTPVLSAITTVNAAVGTPAFGKVYSVSIDVSVSSDKFLQFKPTLKSYDGAAIPALLATLPLPEYKHQLSLPALQALRGF